MNRQHFALSSAQTLVKGGILLSVVICCFFLSPAFKTGFLTIFKATPVLVQTQEKTQDVWQASEPIIASNGLLHEAEVSLLLLLFAFLAVFFFPNVQLGNAAYSCAPHKLFDSFRILPNAP